MPLNRIVFLMFAFILFAPLAIAATPNQPDLKWNREGESYKVAEKRAVEYLKSFKVSEIETGLPDKPFGQWIEELCGSDLMWERNDCGEGGDKEGPVPVCVEVKSSTPSLSLSIAIGSSDGTVDQRPQFFYGRMRQGDKDYPFKKLAEVPEAINDAKRKAEFYRTHPLRKLSQDEAVAFFNNSLTNQVDPQLPSERVESWLSRLLPADAKRTWDLDGCEGRGLQPLCLVSVNKLADGSSVLISMNLEKFQRGIKAPPSISYIEFYNKAKGAIKKFGSLHEFEEVFKKELQTTKSTGK